VCPGRPVDPRRARHQVGSHQARTPTAHHHGLDDGSPNAHHDGATDNDDRRAHDHDGAYDDGHDGADNDHDAHRGAPRRGDRLRLRP
jgi:hypothetical protein